MYCSKIIIFFFHFFHNVRVFCFLFLATSSVAYLDSIARWCFISFNDNVSTFFPRWCSARALCICDELINIVCIRNHLVFRILTMLQRPTIWNLQIKTKQKCTQLNFATPKAMSTKILFDLPRYFTFHSYLPCANKILHSFCNAFATWIDFIALLFLSPSSSMC